MGRLTVRDIAIIAMLSSLCIVSRNVIPLPNIKPVFSCLVVISVLRGWRHGSLFGLVTFIVSSMTLGFGLWVIFQCIASVVVALVTDGLVKVGIPNSVVLVLMSILSALLFGVVMSLESYFYTGWVGILAYWLNGLLWDYYTVIGNLIFTPVIYKTMKEGYRDYLR